MSEPMIIKVSRTELGSALQGAFTHESDREIDLSDVARLQKNEVGLGYWRRPGSKTRVPDFVVINDRSSREFLAWLSTYIPAAFPLSQWCRVFLAADLPEYIQGQPDKTGFGDSTAAWVGAIIGECVAQTGLDDARSALNFVACQATYTYAAAKGCSLWGGRFDWRDLLRRMEKCHVVLSASPRRIDPDSLSLIWNVLDSIDGHSSYFPGSQSTDILTRCCRDLVRRASLSDESIRTLSTLDPDAAAVSGINQMSAEQRVLLLQELGRLAAKMKPSDGQQVVEFLIGYTASKIGGGWRNIDALAEFSRAAPLAPIWFGIAYELGEPDIYGASFDGLARLILRDLETPLNIEERPKFDISWDELEIAVQPNVENRTPFRTQHVRTVQVELFPGVATSVGMDGRKEQTAWRRPTPPQPAPRPSQDRVQTEGAQQVRVQQERLNWLSEEVEKIKLTLRKHGLAEDPPEQGAPARQQGGSKRSGRSGSKRLL